MTGAVAPLIIEDASADPRFRSHPGLKQHGIRSYIAVPIFLRDGQHFGTLCALDTRPARLSEQLLEQFQLFAQLIGFELEAEARQREHDAQVRALQAEVAARERAELRRTAQLRVSRILAEAPAIEQAAEGILDTIGKLLDWDFGALWLVTQEDSGTARCLLTWRRQQSFPEFEALTRRTTFSAGMGLPGRVWSSGEPIWLADVTQDQNFPRLRVAAREGLHTGFGFPILIEDRVEGVLEFFSRDVRTPDEELIQTIGALGSQVGQFLARKRAEEHLQESELRKSAILEAALDAIVTINHEDRIVEWNSAAETIFGFTRAEAVGSRLVDRIVPPAYREAHLKGMAHYLATGEGPVLGKRLELPALRKDGSEFPAELAIVRIHAGEYPLFTSYLRDISERKRLESELRQRAEELAEANARKDQFLATLAHELRNPLAPIRTAVEVMRLRGSDDPLLQRARDTIDRQVEQMRRLVDDLLDVARITRGMVELRKEQVDLGTVVTHAVQTSRPFIDRQEHHLSVSLPMDPVLLEADPTRLEQVITNLLTNAAKFTAPGGQIWVTAGCERGEAVVRVRDTGKGIPPEMLPHVFDLFTQVNPSIDRAEGGLGLGLTLVKNLVRMHGGSIEAHSAGPGHGSEFVVRLPALSTAAPSPSEPPPPLRGAEGRGTRVLVVDDNRDAAETLADLLLLWGHQIKCAHTGPAALKAAREHRPEVVLLDIGLPEMDGYEVARRLRRQPGGEELTIVALTGYGQEEDRRRAREAGFDDYLTKPVEPEALRALLAAARRAPGPAEEPS